MDALVYFKRKDIEDLEVGGFDKIMAFNFTISTSSSVSSSSVVDVV